VTLNRRMTLTVAFACALASTGLYPLFAGSQWFYAGLGAILAVAGSGALSRLRTLPVLVCLGISVAGLLLYLNLVFEARHSWLLVIPTPGSISRLWDLAGTGLNDAHRYAPPAPELPGLLLLATGGIGITAALADLIAVRLRAAALAGLPLLVLFTVPVTMNAQHENLGTAAVFCAGTAGYLAILSADGRERIRVWGRLVSLWRSGSLYDAMGRRGQKRADGAAYAGISADGETSPAHRATGRESTPDTRALAAAGRRVGLASVILALCVPLVIPGLHPSKLFSSGPGIGGSGGTAGAAVALPDTLSQTMRELQQNHPTKVLTYTLDGPGQLQQDDPPYLQTYVYDTLTDSGWQTGDYTAGETQASTMPPPQGLNDMASYRQFKVSVNVTGHDLTNQSAPSFLAIPYPATQVTTPPGVWLVDPELMVFSQDSSADVQVYTATSMDVDPTAAQLRAAARPPSSLAADLELPASYEVKALKQIADRETAGQTTEYGKVNALAAWLSGAAFTYKTSAPPVNSAASLLRFLTTGHAGVCVQSAWAMTVLTRLLGIPARLAGGFTEGTHLSGNSYQVTTDDAHVWAEVYFSGYGWIKFEATPSGGDGTAQASRYQSGAAGGGLAPPPVVPGSVQPSARPTATSSGGAAGFKKPLPDGGSGSGGSVPAKSTGTPWAAVALAIIAAIALAGGVIAIVAPPAHRALSAHAPDGGSRVSRRPRPVSLASVVLVVGAAAIVALALYRLLSHASGPGLRAGWATVGISFGAACAFMFVAPGVARIGIRRWRWLRARDDMSRAHAAWREFRDDLQDLGVGCAPSEPPRTLAGRVGAGLPEPAREAVRRIALAEEQASYAARPPRSAHLRRDGTAARRGIAASARPGSRWRARIFPASVMTAAADVAARIPDLLAALVSRRWAEHRPS
jgi:transglutaminase-like putative cysteine protease